MPQVLDGNHTSLPPEALVRRWPPHELELLAYGLPPSIRLLTLGHESDHR